MNTPNFKYYGFAQPLFGIALIGAIIVAALLLLGCSYWSFGVAAGVIILGEWMGKFRAKRQITEWCRANRLSNATARRRGGFVTWDFSFWTYADMIPFVAKDEQGKEVKITSSYEASLFGLGVRTTCELDGQDHEVSGLDI